jgi:hypothetical protein
VDTVWDELLEGQGGEVVINVGRTYRPLWDDTVCALVTCAAFSHSHPALGTTARPRHRLCLASPEPNPGAASQALLLRSRHSRLPAPQALTRDWGHAGAAGVGGEAVRHDARAGGAGQRRPDRHAPGAPLFGIQAAGHPPFPCSTHCCGARLRCLRNCQACGVAGEAAGAQMHPALTTASCIHVSTTQANNRSIDELCIIPDSCTLQTRPSLGLDPPEIPPHLPTEPKTHARPRSRRRR